MNASIHLHSFEPRYEAQETFEAAGKVVISDTGSVTRFVDIRIGHDKFTIFLRSDVDAANLRDAVVKACEQIIGE